MCYMDATLSDQSGNVVTVSTRISPEQRMVLDYLAARGRIKSAELIRQAIVERYALDSELLLSEARSFFEEGARQVKQRGGNGSS